MTTSSTPLPRWSRSGLVVASLPVAAAIGVFGVVYGAAASQVLGAPTTLLSSLLVFSGAAQFTMVALSAAGASTVGVLVAVATLAVRHLPLGAILRPRLATGRARRVLLSWFLIDETTGLALTVDESPERILAVSGALAYTAWVVGTGVGVAGGTLAAVEPLAAALFPVLFVGLAALAVTERPDAVRAVVAGCLAVGLLLAWPAVGALGAIGVAIGVATVGADR